LFGRSFIRNYGIRYTVFYINLFETSHAKGPQDAAAGFIKRQADIAVVRGNTIIQNAKDLFSFCNNDLKEPRSALFKRRIFRYVESVDRDNIRNFNLISNNRKIHHLYTSKGGEIVVSDLSCYTCDKCIVSDYEHCLHTEHTGQKRLARPEIEPSNNFEQGVFSRIVIIISSENLKTGWIFNAPTIFLVVDSVSRPELSLSMYYSILPSSALTATTESEETSSVIFSERSKLFEGSISGLANRF
jgi:hypothetical protein